MAQLSNRNLATGAIIVGAATLVGLFWWVGETKAAQKSRGYIKCPPQPVVDTSKLRIGDYVVIDLAARAGTFHELTWARLTGSTKDGRLTAKIIGEAGEFGRPKPISSSQHGFMLNQAVDFLPGCVLEIYRPAPKAGRVLCANELPKPNEDLHTELLSAGDFVQLLVKRKEDAAEKLWVQIVEMGPQVIYGIVFSKPQMSESHGYEQGDQVTFLRDCIAGVSFEVPPTE